MSSFQCKPALLLSLFHHTSKTSFLDVLENENNQHFKIKKFYHLELISINILFHFFLQGFLCKYQFSSVQFSLSVMSDSLQPHGFPVHHQLLELTQTHVHWVSDAIQPSHLISSPSLPTFNLSQHQGLLQWVSSSHQVANVLEFQLQHQSFQYIHFQK